jgi:Domain of unknown function (DUF4440)/NIPSNAP
MKTDVQRIYIPILFFCWVLTFNLTAQPVEDVIEIRSYNLKPGSRNQFQKLFVDQALPLLSKWKIEVVAYGPSLHDENSFFLARAYSNLNHRQQSQDAFYGSDDWVKGPREAALALVENYTTVVLPQKNFNINTIRNEMEDHEKLSKLNGLFIKNFIAQDTTTHNEIIHTDFVCVEGNGKIVNRREYMKAWSSDYQAGKFTSFSISDEHIRIFGNMALVRSKTQYTRLQDGKEVKGYSIYTDTYIKENDRWWCVQAQITPIK